MVKQEPHVPYRDSKLTRIMSNCLGGDAYTVLILNAAPGDNQAEETTNTLKYASLAQGMKNHPHADVVAVTTEDPDELDVMRAAAARRRASQHLMLSKQMKGV